MSVVLNIDQPLIGIDLMYVEETKPQGHILYHFIQNQDDFDLWSGKGYSKEEEAEKKIETLTTWWKRMTWKDYNAVLAQSLNLSGEDARLDPIKYRDLKLKSCLKRWNVINVEGQEIEVTNEHIDGIVPEIANELLRVFEQMTEPGEEDQKK